MRKFILMIILVCAGMVQAGEYAYLVFTNSEGTLTALSATDLTMKVNGAQLDVTNAEGTVNFTLTDLAAMQFSVDGINLPEGLENVLNADAPVRVYGVNGISMGKFSSLINAVQQLDNGTYVIVQNGKSQKLIVR
ncbi:MAG: hypothetical protein II827_05635 [Paludibacteraceae bacterium]|nr:hypothetical protein [Paludibacteraceae bacterium]